MTEVDSPRFAVGLAAAAAAVAVAFKSSTLCVCDLCPVYSTKRG